MNVRIENNASVGIKKKEIRVVTYCNGINKETDLATELLNEFTSKYLRTLYFDENTKAELMVDTQVYMEAPWEFNNPAEERLIFSKLVRNAKQHKISAVVITHPAYFAPNLHDLQKILDKFASLGIRIFTNVGDEFIKKNGVWIVRPFCLVVKANIDDPKNEYFMVASQNGSRQLWRDDLNDFFYVYDSSKNGVTEPAVFETTLLMTKTVEDFKNDKFSNDEREVYKIICDNENYVVRFDMCDQHGRNIYAWFGLYGA